MVYVGPAEVRRPWCSGWANQQLSSPVLPGSESRDLGTVSRGHVLGSWVRRGMGGPRVGEHGGLELPDVTPLERQRHGAQYIFGRGISY